MLSKGMNGPTEDGVVTFGLSATAEDSVTRDEGGELSDEAAGALLSCL